jgi:hypothetical protein
MIERRAKRAEARDRERAPGRPQPTRARAHTARSTDRASSAAAQALVSHRAESNETKGRERQLVGGFVLPMNSDHLLNEHGTTIPNEPKRPAPRIPGAPVAPNEFERRSIRTRTRGGAKLRRAGWPNERRSTPNEPETPRAPRSLRRAGGGAPTRTTARSKRTRTRGDAKGGSGVAGCPTSPHDARSKRTRSSGAPGQPTPHVACSQTSPERGSFSVA